MDWQHIISTTVALLCALLLVHLLVRRKRAGKCGLHDECGVQTIVHKTDAPILLIIASLCASVSFAGTEGVIKGTVTLGEERSVLRGVNVRIVGSRKRTATDDHGLFRIDGLVAGAYDIEVFFLGYRKEILRGLTVEEGKETEISVVLAESPFQLNEVVVTGSLNKHLLKNTPVITEVISRRDIAAIGSSDFADVLRAQTGIELGTSIGQTQIARLQGLRKNQVLILVDGERLTGKVDDAVDLGQIPVNMIEKIEVVKGPLSSVYGSDALGGVINIVTRDPENAAQLHVSTAVGSYGRQDYEISAAHAFDRLFGESRGMRFFINGGWNKFFGIDYSQRDHLMEMPEYDRKNVNFKSVLQFDGVFFLDLKADYYRDRLRWLAGIDGYYRYTDHGSNEKLSFSARAGSLVSPTTSLTVTAYTSQNDHGSSEENQFATIRRSDSRELLQTYRTQVSTVPYESSVLTAGYEANIEGVTSPRILAGSKDVVNHVAYLEDEWTLSAATLAIGGRYSHNSVYGTFLAPRASLLFRASDHLTLRTSYGRGYRAPSILELYIDYNNAGVGYSVLGNPALRPEASHGLNLGFDYARDDLIWFRANAYYNSITNLINYYLVSTAPNVYSYQNIFEATTRGVDIDVDFHPFQRLSIAVGYNYTSSRDNAGNDIPFVSPHSLTGRLGYTFGEGLATATLRAKWVDRKPVVDEQVNLNVQSGGQAASRFYAPAHTIVDAKASVRIIEALEGSAGVNNIFDRTYYPFGQVKGREVYAGLSYNLQ